MWLPAILLAALLLLQFPLPSSGAGTVRVDGGSEFRNGTVEMFVGVVGLSI